jgi:quinol monooxygenase YgiN
MFAVIRHYHFDKKDGAEIDRAVHEEFVPIIRKAKGFQQYYWLDTGEGEGASFGVFEDKAGADESVRLASNYVRDHLSKLLTEKPEIIEGPVAANGAVTAGEGRGRADTVARWDLMI